MCCHVSCQVPWQHPGRPADGGGVYELGDQDDQRDGEEAGAEAGEGVAHHLLEGDQDGDRRRWHSQPRLLNLQVDDY